MFLNKRTEDGRISADFHFHSLYSDGAFMPADIVNSFLRVNPYIRYLALSDHDTFLGCEEFINACNKKRIKGFVSAEIGGAHPDFPHDELHLLVNFGSEWNSDIAKKISKFNRYFNECRRVDTENIFFS